MQKISFLLFVLCAFCLDLHAQKVRPDAFPPQPEPEPKVINMAQTVEQMANWDRYPTYSTYVEMMNGYASQYPSICRLDTIGTSVEGRLILCVKISDNVDEEETDEPEFFYSSTIHGDEVTGYHLMLHLIDTLLKGYGSNSEYTDLINRTQIYINPLANPDGTYHAGNGTVQGSIRYNSNWVDLNRNYPDPFGTQPMSDQQQENSAMIDYVTNHHFKLSANIHGGSEVMNYPWDSYRSSQATHPYKSWFEEVGKRFVDTCRKVTPSSFTDVNSSGVIDGGDWYVISNGRQDYMNYYHQCLEFTMELSSTKTLSTDQLHTYWETMHHSLVNYIKEIFNLPSDNAIEETEYLAVNAFPNPTTNLVSLSKPTSSLGYLYDFQGRLLTSVDKGTTIIDLSNYATGLYILRIDGQSIKIIKH